MFAKINLMPLLALVFLTSGGCCNMWDRWCNRPHYQQAPACCPTPQPQCCPTGSYSSPGGAVPVPPAPGTSWQRCP